MAFIIRQLFFSSFFFYILITSPRERAHSFRSIGNVKLWDELPVAVYKIDTMKAGKNPRRVGFLFFSILAQTFKHASSLISIISFERRKIDDFISQL